MGTNAHRNYTNNNNNNNKIILIIVFNMSSYLSYCSKFSPLQEFKTTPHVVLS
jgi:hypothetical protein